MRTLIHPALEDAPAFRILIKAAEAAKFQAGKRAVRPNRAWF
jgi:hypothetical protein